MKDVQQLCAVLAGILAISLIALAGVVFGDHTVVRLAIIAAVAMYLVQALDALASHGLSQRAPDSNLVDWVYRGCLLFWAISVLAALAALMMVMF